MEQMQHPRPPADMNADENSDPAETGNAGMAADNASGHSPLPAKKPGESDEAYGRRLREYYNDQSLGRYPEIMLPTIKRPGARGDNGTTGGKVVKGAIYSLAMVATAITWGLPGVIAAYFLLKGADNTLEKRKVDARNADIFTHVSTGHLHGVRQWLEAGGDPNLANSAGQTLLMMAAASQQDEVAKLLLSCPDTCVNQACATGETALHIAAVNNDESMVSLLLKNETHTEINPNARARNGLTPIFATTSPAILSLFVDHPGTDINLRVDYGSGERTRLHRAVAQGSDEEVAALLAHPGIDVNALCSFAGDDWFEITPLHSAIARDRLNVVRMLLADGRVDVNRRGGKSRWSPLNYATSGDRKKKRGDFPGHPRTPEG